MPYTYNYCPNCGEKLILRSDGARACERKFADEPTPVGCGFVHYETELMRGKNSEGKCAWDSCDRPLERELGPGGFGPTVIGYMCRECHEQFAASVERARQDILDELDRIVVTSIPPVTTSS
jgi:hypothetical protein